MYKNSKWLEFDEDYIYIKLLWLFGRESTWGVTVLIGKRKGMAWGFKEEGKERNLWCLALDEQHPWTEPQEREEENRGEIEKKNNMNNMP